MAKVDIFQPLVSKVLVRFQTSTCGICGDKVALGHVYL